MFGRMTVMPIVQLGADADLQVAITTLLQEADQPEITRWIEFPALVLLSLRFLRRRGNAKQRAAVSRICLLSRHSAHAGTERRNQSFVVCDGALKQP